MIQIADPDALAWIAPPGMTPERFAQVQTHVVAALDAGNAEEVYRIDHRSVYKLQSPELGAMAVKEVRHKRIPQRFKLRYFKEAKAVREFYTTAAFASRGGIVPELFAMGLRQNLFGLWQVFVFMHWMDDAIPLRDYIANAGGRLSIEAWQTIADVLLDSAEKGLVHGGHSPDNILVAERESGLEVTIIDLAESVIHDAMDEEGYVNDLSRLVRRFFDNDEPSVCSPESLHDFIRVIAEASWDDAETQRRHMLEIAKRADLSTDGL